MKRLDHIMLLWIRDLKKEDRALLLKYDVATMSQAHTVVTRIEEARARHANPGAEMVRDCFSPPEDMLTCNMCDDEFSMHSSIDDLEHHLKYRHVGQWNRIVDKVMSKAEERSTS